MTKYHQVDIISRNMIRNKSLSVASMDKKIGKRYVENTFDEQCKL